VIQEKSLSLTFNVKNNPFVKQSPSIKTYKLLEHTDMVIRIQVLNKVFQVPYCDYFYTLENILVVTPNPNANACMYRHLNTVVMVKSTIMKGKIESGNQQGC